MIEQESLPNISPPIVPEREFLTTEEILGITLEYPESYDVFDSALEVLARPDIDPEIKEVIVGLGKVAADALRRTYIDDMTGLPNRTGFGLKFNQVIGEVLEPGDPAYLAYMDLDRFKEVNDTHGHDKGDEVLKAMVNIHLREGEFLARVGGDEFVAVVLPKHNSIQDSADGTNEWVHRERHSEDDIIDGIITRLRNEIEAIAGEIEGCEGVSVSIGCVKIETYLSPEDILRSADARMRREKEDRGASR